MTPQEKPHYLGHRKRLKDKFLTNSTNFADYELLELLLFSSHARKDVKPLAKKLLTELGSISAVLNADIQMLKNLPDVNENVLLSLKLAREIIVRSSKEKISNKPIISKSEEMHEYCKLGMGNLKEEQFRILFLDKKHHLIADELLKQGSVEAVEIDVKNILKKALNFFAKSVILMHNHPNLDSKPSKADIVNTDRILKTLKTIDVKVDDHLIIGKNGDLFSFKSHGFI
ncbi:MAG: DNA repair protein RadC [Rickettsiales bacterium]|jgi:DNA repair protein RadC